MTRIAVVLLAVTLIAIAILLLAACQVPLR
jgi:hypothetical protein